MYERTDFGDGKQERMAQEIQRERVRSERFARHLSEEATRQWQKALTGMIALPTAAALGAGAIALYVAAFIERGFEIFQQQAEEIRQRAGELREERAGEIGRSERSREGVTPTSPPRA